MAEAEPILMEARALYRCVRDTRVVGPIASGQANEVLAGLRCQERRHCYEWPHHLDAMRWRKDLFFGPDGFKVERLGNIFWAWPRGLSMIASDGTLLSQSYS